jgi:hypothetical protein
MGKCEDQHLRSCNFRGNMAWLGTIHISNLKWKFRFSEIMGMSKFEVICIGHHQVMESIGLRETVVKEFSGICE